MEEISQLAKELREINEEEKKIKDRKETLRRDLIEFAAADYKDKKFLRPTTTITVPDEFWAATEYTEEKFLNSSWPTWELEASQHDIVRKETTYVLRKKSEYMPFNYEDDEIKLTKSVTEPTPEINWETLKLERPDIFVIIAKEVVSYEIDEDFLSEAIHHDPEVVSILQRHTKYTRAPQQRIGIKDR